MLAELLILFTCEAYATWLLREVLTAGLRRSSGGLGTGMHISGIDSARYHKFLLHANHSKLSFIYFHRARLISCLKYLLASFSSKSSLVSASSLEGTSLDYHSLHPCLLLMSNIHRYCSHHLAKIANHEIDSLGMISSILVEWPLLILMLLSLRNPLLSKSLK